nr:hypothetical protein Iba_chr04cCG14780 [Ipomoea batatas]
MIDEFEESLAKKKQQKKPLPSPSPVVTKKKNVCCANDGKTMESPTNGQPQDQFDTKLIISEPKEELAVPKTKMASEDNSLQCSQEAQSVGGAKKNKSEYGPSAKSLNFINVKQRRRMKARKPVSYSGHQPSSRGSLSYTTEALLCNAKIISSDVGENYV